MQDDLVINDYTDSDLLPNQPDILGSAVDEEYEQQRRVEQSKVEAARPLFDELNQWFTEQIAETDKIDYLDPNNNNVPLQSQIIARQQLKQLLQIVQNNLNTRFKGLSNSDNE